MKKGLFAGLAVGMMVLGMVGLAGATSFTSTTNVNKRVQGTGEVTWLQAMPGDFQVPYDTVQSANLSVTGFLVSGNNDQIAVNGFAEGTLQNAKWNWSSMSWYAPAIDIASDISSAWTTGDKLKVSLKYIEKDWLGLIIGTSVLNMNYTNNVAPVPEPATMMLFGSGLAGLVGMARRRKKAA